MENKLLIFFFSSLIIANAYSMETKKRKFNQIYDSNEKQAQASNKSLEKFKIIRSDLKDLSINTNDIIQLLKKRLDTTKAFKILYKLPYELILDILDIIIKQTIMLTINEITSSEANRPYFSGPEDPTIAQNMQKALDRIFTLVNNHFKEFYIHLIILMKFATNKKIQSICKTLKEMLEKPEIKKKIRTNFNNILLDKLNVFENPNLLKAFEHFIVHRQIYNSYMKRWDFLFNYLLEHPKQLPYVLKIYFGHWLAASNRAKDLYTLITTHNCSTTDYQSIECYNDYILADNRFFMNELPQFKRGTLLMTALHFKAFDVAKWLIQNNIQIDHENSYGNTAIMYCIYHLYCEITTVEDMIEYLNIIRLLLNAGSANQLHTAINLCHRPLHTLKYDPVLMQYIFSEPDQKRKILGQVIETIRNWLFQAIESSSDLPTIANS